jgi:hypothetical protein
MDKRDEFIEYFKHMEDEHIKCPLGGMAWDDVAWWQYDAIHKYKLFSTKELESMFPILLKGISD